MSGDDTRVLITGLGAITPLGDDVPSTWSAMLAGRSGVRRLTDSWTEDLPVRIAAPAMVGPASEISHVQLRHMDRCEQLALMAAKQAWHNAGSPQVEPERLGISFSSGMGGVNSFIEAHRTFTEKGWRKLSPFTMPMFMINGSASWISIEFNAQAGTHTTVSACASSADAIGYGIDMIRSGRADVVLAGGTETAIFSLNIAAFAIMRALSCRNDEPERASRPFDKARDGFVLGEGAGVIVLESAEHAAKRGAVVHAVAAGVGYSADAYHIARGRPDGGGIALAMRRALDDAGVAAEQVVHINAHATSTLLGDRAEALAIQRALGGTTDNAVVSATKSMTGHLLGGAGVIGSIAAICALRDGVAPPTINLDDPADEVIAAGVDIATDMRELRIGLKPGVALSNSSGFGGQNVTLAFSAA